MVVLGDVLSDLPPVSTFCQAEGANYLGDPRSITQAWLRRDPPAGQVWSKPLAGTCTAAQWGGLAA